MKPLIYAAGNETIKGINNISYYIFEKDKSFFEWLNKLLVDELSFGSVNHPGFIFIRSEDEDFGEDEIRVKNIKRMIDVHEKYEDGKKTRIDLFYGSKRIYFSMRAPRKTREKLGKYILKTKDWIKVLEVYPQNPSYAGRKVKEIF